MSKPQRGEVWLADLGLGAKVRPVLIISVPFKDSDRAIITIVPHTTKVIGSEHEVHLPISWLEKGAFNVQSVMPAAPPQFIRRIGALTPQQLTEIESALRRWAGLK
jgi:mRNA interferase MazF